MAEAGIAVYTYDAHGHGKSEPLDAGNRCLILKFDDLVSGNSGVADELMDPLHAAQVRSMPDPLLISTHALPAPVAQVDDVFKFLSVIESRAGGKLPTLFIGGQSLGALVATHAVMRQQGRWAGLILHSAALDVVWTPVLRYGV